jgi:DnaJ-class molecular chaperone
MRDCPDCDGMGALILSWPDGAMTSRPCKPCRGTGQVPDDPPPDAADLRDPDEEPEPIEEE